MLGGGGGGGGGGGNYKYNTDTNCKQKHSTIIQRHRHASQGAEHPERTCLCHKITTGSRYTTSLY